MADLEAEAFAYNEPVIREQLPTVEQAIRIAEEAQVDELIARLMEKGLVGAAHEVSLWFWGYGFEDTDDLNLYTQISRDSAVGSHYIERKTA